MFSPTAPARSGHSVNICQMSRVHRRGKSFRAGRGFAHDLMARPSDPPSGAFPYASLWCQLSKEMLIHDCRSGDFHYLCVSEFPGKAGFSVCA